MKVFITDSFNGFIALRRVNISPWQNSTARLRVGSLNFSWTKGRVSDTCPAEMSCEQSSQK